MGKLEHFETADSVTVFWEKPKELPENYIYRVFLDGEERASGVKTHATITELRPLTTYHIEVGVFEVADPAEGDAAGKLWGSLGALDITTESVREIIDITKEPYRAVGDGITMNTEAIQQAIDDCGKMQKVYIPAGVFMTGALRLHSDMELYLEEGAVLKGTEDLKDYQPKIKSRFEGIEMECYSSLINIGELDHTAGYVCTNVVIQGKGTIESGGKALAKNVVRFERERLKDYIVSLGDEILTYENNDTIPARARPRLVNISNAQNVRMTGVSFKNGASWNVHMVYSDQIITNGCAFYSEDVWNGDGWDPDSSTNCTIFDCEFHTGDDAIAIKSGKNPEGNIINRPCEHIRIFDCTSGMGHGITIGSEMSGGISDVRIWDCDMERSMNGVEIKGTRKRGGYVRDIHVRDCTAARILIHSVGYNDDGIGAKEPPVFEKCTFEHMDIKGIYLEKDGSMQPCKAVELYGFEEEGHSLRDIHFKDVRLGGDISMKYCRNVTFEMVGQ